MSALDWTLLLVWIGAVPQTIFVLLYGTTNQWWRSRIGRALFTKALGLALLLDLSLIGFYFPKALSPTESNFVVALVVVGACLQLFALLHDKRAKRQG